jgi:hypothetical protein
VLVKTPAETGFKLEREGKWKSGRPVSWERCHGRNVERLKLSEREPGENVAKKFSGPDGPIMLLVFLERVMKTVRVTG